MLSKKEFAIVSNLRFISRTNFMLSWVEHELNRNDLSRNIRKRNFGYVGSTKTYQPAHLSSLIKVFIVPMKILSIFGYQKMRPVKILIRLINSSLGHMSKCMFWQWDSFVSSDETNTEENTCVPFQGKMPSNICKYAVRLSFALHWNISEFLSENFQFLAVKFSIYLNRRVFVMVS